VTDGLDPNLRLALDAQMGRLLAQVFVRAEQYPDLKSADTVMMLQRTLNEVEAQIAAARRSYNAAVTWYNTGIESFPANLAAGTLGFLPRPLFEATPDEERVPAAPSSLIESR
jgi:LemA protein